MREPAFSSCAARRERKDCFSALSPVEESATVDTNTWSGYR